MFVVQGYYCPSFASSAVAMCEIRRPGAYGQLKTLTVINWVAREFADEHVFSAVHGNQGFHIFPHWEIGRLVADGVAQVGSTHCGAPSGGYFESILVQCLMG